MSGASDPYECGLQDGLAAARRTPTITDGMVHAALRTWWDVDSLEEAMPDKVFLAKSIAEMRAALEAAMRLKP